jgi:hypothetical protein
MCNLRRNFRVSRHWVSVVRALYLRVLLYLYGKPSAYTLCGHLMDDEVALQGCSIETLYGHRSCNLGVCKHWVCNLWWVKLSGCRQLGCKLRVGRHLFSDLKSSCCLET